MLERAIEKIEEEIEAKQAEIADKQGEIDSFDKSEYVSESQYDEMLDDCYESSIAGVEVCTSYALKQTDPVAYRCGYNDYVDSIDYSVIEEFVELEEELEELESELEELEEQLEEAEEELEESQNL